MNPTTYSLCFTACTHSRFGNEQKQRFVRLSYTTQEACNQALERLLDSGGLLEVSRSSPISMRLPGQAKAREFWMAA